jgi:hypothetical protein
MAKVLMIVGAERRWIDTDAILACNVHYEHTLIKYLEDGVELEIVVPGPPWVNSSNIVCAIIADNRQRLMETA